TLEAHRAIGMILFHLGEFTGARGHLEQGSGLYDPQQHGALALLSVADPGVTCLSYLARTLWHLGYPEQALKKCYEALELARSQEVQWTADLHRLSRARPHRLRRNSGRDRDHAGRSVQPATIARSHLPVTDERGFWPAIDAMRRVHIGSEAAASHLRVVGDG